MSTRHPGMSFGQFVTLVPLTAGYMISGLLALMIVLIAERGRLFDSPVMQLATRGVRD